MARLPDIIAVDRPHGLPRLPWEARTIVYPDGPGEPGHSYWTANAWVSNAVAAIDNHALAAWVCRTLNAAVIAEQAAIVAASTPTPRVVRQVPWRVPA